MNAPTSKSNYVTCPICNRSSVAQPAEMFNGLFTCPYCHSHLVISWSGHYVRDPFSLQQLDIGQMLRRQSRPLARLRRDLSSQYLPIIVVISSAIFFGGAIAALSPFNFKLNIFDGVLEWVQGTDKLND
jgi:RNA polymerase subunit RPABC4/transcription elongation factor Spt4